VYGVMPELLKFFGGYTFYGNSSPKQRRGPAFRAHRGRYSLQGSEHIRYGGYLRCYCPFYHELTRYCCRRPGRLHLPGDGLPELPYPGRYRYRTAWSHVSQGRLDLRLDEQSLWPILGLFRWFLRLVARYLRDRGVRKPGQHLYYRSLFQVWPECPDSALATSSGDAYCHRYFF